MHLALRNPKLCTSKKLGKRTLYTTLPNIFTPLRATILICQRILGNFQAKTRSGRHYKRVNHLSLQSRSLFGF